MMNDTMQVNGTPTSADPGVNPETTIDNLVARRPELMPALQRFGFDLCCGGGDPQGGRRASRHSTGRLAHRAV